MSRELKAKMQGPLPGIEESKLEKVEIFVSYRSLIDTEISSKIDPFAVMEMEVQGEWSEVYKSETVIGQLNADFLKSFVCDYIFERKQPIRIQVFHYNSPTNSELIGEVETSLAQIVVTKNSTFISDIKNQKQKSVGTITLKAEKVVQCNDDFNLELKGKSIKDMRFCTRSSPFLIFYRTSESKSPIKVHQTEVADRNLNPTYKPIKIKSQKLCNGDYQMPIIVEVWDYHSNGQHQQIGQGIFSVKDLVGRTVKTINLTVKKSKESAGQLLVVEANVVEKPLFLDYIRGGINLNLICAVDFTGSNGVPSSPESLHAIHINGQLNSYQQAIQSVGEILLNYDEDKMVPFYGFGKRILHYYFPFKLFPNEQGVQKFNFGCSQFDQKEMKMQFKKKYFNRFVERGAKPKLPHFNYNQALHRFPINGNPEQPDVFQLKGLMDAYKNFLQYVELSGPTLFNPIIQQSMAVAQQSKDKKDKNYYILLILTDGEIQDMQATIISIVASSRLPLSIIIIGIGNADFTNMEILDGDDGLVDSNGQVAERDLVQFVPYNDFKEDQLALTLAVLEELPDQVVEYYDLVEQKPQAVASQLKQSIQVPNIPEANQNFGQNLIKAQLMKNVLLGTQSEESLLPPTLQSQPSESIPQIQDLKKQATLLNQMIGQISLNAIGNQPKQTPQLYFDEYTAPPPANN